MTGKQKKTMWRIVAAGAALIGLHLAPLEGLWAFAAYLAVYLLIGYDVLIRAGKGIVSGQVFDENFLMAVATVGAMALGTFGEAVEVMLFYQASACRWTVSSWRGPQP